MCRFISLMVLILLFAPIGAEAVDIYRAGDSVFVTIYPQNWGRTETLEPTGAGNYLQVVWSYLTRDTTYDYAGTVTLSNYVVSSDSIDEYSHSLTYPITMCTNSSEQATFFVWSNIAEFMGMTGYYHIRWAFYDVTDPQRGNRGAYTYKVVPRKGPENHLSAEDILTALNEGVHWSPRGSDYGLAALSRRGPYPCSVYVFESVDSIPVSGCELSIKGSSRLSVEGLGVTDANGLAVLGLTAGGYYMTPHRTGYKFENTPYGLSIPNTSNDTIWGVEFSPGAPANPEMCNVYGFMADIARPGGDDIRITITNDTDYLQSPEGRIIIGYRVEVTPDSTGYWERPLYPNSVLDPGNSTYEFVFKVGRREYKRDDVIVPDQPEWRFQWGE